MISLGEEEVEHGGAGKEERRGTNSDQIVSVSKTNH